MSHQIVGDAGLSAENLGALRASLREQRQFRLEQLRRFSEPATDRAVRVRQQRSASQREVHIKLTASARMVLADVEAALERMDQGTYGTCHRCERPIAVERLQVVPQARFCGPCHQVRGADR
ncbi:TraR/DksA family transcriptional regulator [Streptomyces cavernicola]|uniref:TraR/DksA C4-type zinc finger protein n=1 Tax=Streptomyces cavernicola TaxID=3043613 RepID=A0ABT6SL98_9ACTN|nr:TraR/DksA C4-type zinc finger protein [Streptomyces sp. B-S-A6]MDI3408966.1 TraR/DksA C4-type zinc finger protein [Streptomyces sp. B-S-A6]